MVRLHNMACIFWQVEILGLPEQYFEDLRIDLVYNEPLFPLAMGIQDYKTLGQGFYYVKGHIYSSS